MKKSAHLEYDFFKYVGIVIASFLLWWCIFAVLDNPKPEERLDIFLAVAGIPETSRKEISQVAELAVADDESIRKINVAAYVADEQLSTTLLASDIVIISADFLEVLLPSLEELNDDMCELIGITDVLHDKVVEVTGSTTTSLFGAAQFYVGIVKAENLMGGGKNADPNGNYQSLTVMKALITYFS